MNFEAASSTPVASAPLAEWTRCSKTHSDFGVAVTLAVNIESALTRKLKNLFLLRKTGAGDPD